MKKLKILIAEDEDDVRKLIVEAFKAGGFEAIGVRDGAEAVKKTENLMPDLVLLDVRMPNMTGFEACKILKNQSSTKKIPVVFLSAYGQEAEVTTGLQLGAEDYLLKPFSVSDLIWRINKILSKYGKTV